MSEINIFFHTHFFINNWVGTFYANQLTLDADLIAHLLHGTGSIPTSRHAVKQLLRENDRFQRNKNVLAFEKSIVRKSKEDLEKFLREKN